MVLASITLLPAFLGLAGHRINRLGVRRQPAIGTARDGGLGLAAVGRARAPACRGVRRRRHGPAAGAGRPGARAPARHPRRGHPARQPHRAARLRPRRRRLRARHQRPAGHRRRHLQAIRASSSRCADAIAADPGIAAVAPPEVNADAGVATLHRLPDHRPRRTTRRSTRSSGCAPRCSRRCSAGSPAQAHVGGQTATWADIGDRVKDRLPLFIGAVVLLSFLLLTVVFRSVLVPLKAALLNLLSIGAAYGVHGHGVPVGLGRRPHRPGVDRADRPVHPDVHVRHPVRPLDGLRGLPALPGAGGVPAPPATTTAR